MKEKDKKKSLASWKANRTRQARKDFENAYPATAHIAKALLEGYSVSSTAYFFTDFDCVSSVAAVQANLNRPGRYRDMALACNWKQQY
jgi:hypothetical protein